MNNLECKQKISMLEENKVFITTGRLCYIKGWEFMIDSFRKVKKEIANSIFILLGEGEDRVIIEKYCHEEIKRGSIILEGPKTPEEVATYLMLQMFLLWVL